jgi:hypothetical protein
MTNKARANNGVQQRREIADEVGEKRKDEQKTGEQNEGQEMHRGCGMDMEWEIQDMRQGTMSI